jgi:hypothetical protein
VSRALLAVKSQAQFRLQLAHAAGVQQERQITYMWLSSFGTPAHGVQGRRPAQFCVARLIAPPLLSL